MPFKSKAQRRKFAELLVKGEISPQTYEEWNRETGGAELPERVRPMAGKKVKRGASKPRRAKTPPRARKPSKRRAGARGLSKPAKRR
ncbi:MAG TPA: hypothetical protein VGR67_14295 [Candidatus Polarisedimenticolia bacterium]|jgi:hypothetical protein|nr:hypothetical protein [Candidatus Polarisedimenticolia bacterium]